jgi:hypothetical protein
MPADAETIIGINEVGEHDQAASPTDSEWGRTTEDGATLQLSTTTQELHSGQAKMAEDTHINQVSMAIQFNVLFAELTTLQQMLGIAAAQLTGDLEDTTPTEEVLTIDQDSIGAVEKGLYVIGPGPVSTRRLEAARALLADMGDIAFSDTEWQIFQATWDLINTADGTGVVTITDAA